MDDPRPHRPRRDIAPGRILPDSAIINAATADPDTVEELTALPIFGGSRQRRSAQMWLDALARARATTTRHRRPNSRPPDRQRRRGGASRKPEAAARLEAARAGLAELSQRVSVPTENLVTPEVVRRLCWDWQPVADTEAAVDEFLREAQVRPGSANSSSRCWPRRSRRTIDEP